LGAQIESSTFNLTFPLAFSFGIGHLVQKSREYLSHFYIEYGVLMGPNGVKLVRMRNGTGDSVLHRNLLRR
jgi:hypothetical protein